MIKTTDFSSTHDTQSTNHTTQEKTQMTQFPENITPGTLSSGPAYKITNNFTEAQVQELMNPVPTYKGVSRNDYPLEYLILKIRDGVALTPDDKDLAAGITKEWIIQDLNGDRMKWAEE